MEISQETFDRIMAQKQIYDCLMIVGVQQWHGYAAALRMYEQMQAQRPTVEQCQEAQKKLEAQ